MKKIKKYLLLGLFSLFFAFSSSSFAADCEGIKLNTKIPFVSGGDGCIETKGEKATTGSDAFVQMMGGMSQLVVSLILIGGFLVIVIAGVMIASSRDDNGLKKGKELITKVVLGIALLGASGIILRMINPFFK